MWTHFLAYIAGVATGPLIVGLAVGGFVGMYGGVLTIGAKIWGDL